MARKKKVPTPNQLVSDEELDNQTPDEEEEEETTSPEPGISDDEEEEEETSTLPTGIAPAAPLPETATDDALLPPERPQPPPETPFISHENIQKVYGEHVVHCRRRTYTYGGAHFGPGLVNVINKQTGEPLTGINDAGKEDTVANIIRTRINQVEKPVVTRKQSIHIALPVDPLNSVNNEPLFFEPRED